MIACLVEKYLTLYLLHFVKMQVGDGADAGEGTSRGPAAGGEVSAEQGGDVGEEEDGLSSDSSVDETDIDMLNDADFHKVKHFSKIFLFHFSIYQNFHF